MESRKKNGGKLKEYEAGTQACQFRARSIRFGLNMDSVNAGFDRVNGPRKQIHEGKGLMYLQQRDAEYLSPVLLFFLSLLQR